MGKTEPVLEIDYRNLGTIKIDELKQALWEDIEALKDQFGVSFVTGVKLLVPATNEFGDPLLVKRLSTGATVRHLDTHHYHPASITNCRGMSMKQPCYIGLEEARQVLAGMGINLNERQMQRAAELDSAGRRKLPFFIDPIEGKLRIDKDDLISVYFNRQSEARNKLREH
jgi:hypothetical protein